MLIKQKNNQNNLFNVIILNQQFSLQSNIELLDVNCVKLLKGQSAKKTIS